MSLPALGSIVGYLTNNPVKNSIDLVLINPVIEPFMLTNNWDGANLVLSWPGSGLLLQATNLAGP